MRIAFLLMMTACGSSATTTDGGVDAGAVDATFDANDDASDEPDVTTDAAAPTDTLACATAQTVWPTAGGCFTRRYATSLIGPTTLPTPAWQASPGPDTEITASTSTVYAVGEFTTLKAWALDTGNYLWDGTMNLGFSVGGATTLDGAGAAYVWVAAQGNVMAFAASSGTYQWTATAPPTGKIPGDYNGSVALGSDGTLYVGGNGITAFTPAGKFKWQEMAAITLENTMLAPFADGEAIVVRQSGASSNELFAFDAAGKQRFAYPIALDFPDAPSLFVCNVVIAPNRSGTDRTIDAIDHEGKRAWTVKPFTSNGTIPHVAFATDGAKIYAGAIDSGGNVELAVLDCAGHVLRHQTDFGGPVTVDGAGNVFGLCGARHPCAVDATGTNLWTLTTITSDAPTQIRLTVLPNHRLAIPLPTTTGLQIVQE